jgi:hypothetical protein
MKFSVSTARAGAAGVRDARESDAHEAGQPGAQLVNGFAHDVFPLLRGEGIRHRAAIRQ